MCLYNDKQRIDLGKAKLLVISHHRKTRRRRQMKSGHRTRVMLSAREISDPFVVINREINANNYCKLNDVVISMNDKRYSNWSRKRKRRRLTDGSDLSESNAIIVDEVNGNEDNVDNNDDKSDVCEKKQSVENLLVFLISLLCFNNVKISMRGKCNKQIITTSTNYKASNKKIEYKFENDNEEYHHHNGTTTTTSKYSSQNMQHEEQKQQIKTTTTETKCRKMLPFSAMKNGISPKFTSTIRAFFITLLVATCSIRRMMIPMTQVAPPFAMASPMGEYQYK